MGDSEKILMNIFNRLLEHFGPQGWWPVENPESLTAPFEIAAGAILTQNTNWKNVESALKNLKGKNLLDPMRLDSFSEESLSSLIRPAGYFRVKAKRLKNYTSYLVQNYSGNVPQSLKGDLHKKRGELLQVNGIGPETADSILLYAGGRPIFVIDAYTKRVLVRHRIAVDEMKYDEYQSIFHDALLRNGDNRVVELFNEFHALFVACGKHYCRPKNPRCSECPLEKT
ncbi:MAG: endonuclease III domain-containing protein [Deltaproteobacteria bacterium]|uniref:Endonuclease III domain-containing protein n=1 Tax=Candidatus Zymogenus saltonus TaxID=2844893 RepID=A0A9D8KEX1_9DELT|nr:endonuclease III domain-containing protein [Candidatus Zymogenus saltonus]